MSEAKQRKVHFRHESIVTRALCADRAEASGNGGPAVRLEGPEVPKVAVGVYWPTGDTTNGTKLAGETQ